MSNMRIRLIEQLYKYQKIKMYPYRCSRAENVGEDLLVVA